MQLFIEVFKVAIDLPETPDAQPVFCIGRDRDTARVPAIHTNTVDRVAIDATDTGDATKTRAAISAPCAELRPSQTKVA